MLVKEFDYHLPEELIARYPAPERDGSRLMLLNRESGTIGHGLFRDIADHLRPGDLLVLNDTRVIPARLFGRKATGGRVEIFLVRRQETQAERWSCLMRSSKGMRPGQLITLAGAMTALVVERLEPEGWLLEFQGAEPFSVWLEREGEMPLPPYLQRPAESGDQLRYQTVFARSAGAVAAPTAGLHFTPELLERLAERGVATACLTLHTGPGTFQPLRVERVQDHRIHSERYHISAETCQAIAETKQRGGRVVAVGTTSARTLEYAADEKGGLCPGSGDADIFIYPGYRFRVVDALVTNFHLPESTLIMLVSAFAGKEYVFHAYHEAARLGYRFYSYGDAMFIE
ncbi:tRNA preQ1(34) S-adenosylmethionine ribosyltransferase-isomerase QueA [Pelobacter propionicus]|uniref:S-adenosylmethionine:tRNA ribosyltransferase-isomerase n=1 Tax=Pelobacter propionicus (strain DSM 2379 / NBRC 103807 / OttBd1) TaxID=338966 RepID=QUEA_PELPD|nr:tRNA preQ1(34) S-adenosylmethionine ribosyltransferase-isomerase QueA [Pelobacter propionicus]A1APZ3.1 RecName: Full=S-adenosylmethionine:tRNA ribosyltransferase-isomerase; AltName: Full=Queuosine biosynthesis protein QueA [Pelobacter propionicus DSM 2379]ABK99413.1 S-adenosylmethionine--tRNA ribosyltransferase-isomerase [Pelobacter propionicus DSM 2379]